MAASKVTVKRLITNQDITVRGVRVLGQAAQRVVKDFIEPKTPKLTGELRESLGSRVMTDGSNIVVEWSATAMPQAYILEKDMDFISRIRHFTTPGTRAPYLGPGVEEGFDGVMVPAMAEWIDP